MRRAKQKEMLRKEFRNKYQGKGKTNTGSSFSAISHHFYYHKTHGNLGPTAVRMKPRCSEEIRHCCEQERSHGVLRSTAVVGSLVTLGLLAVLFVQS